MHSFVFGPVKSIALLGASSLFLPLRQWASSKSISTAIITSPDQAPTLKDVQPIVVDELTADLKSTLGDISIAISLGARWIMKEPVRKALFADRVVNCHGARLPFERGGGNWSYRAMRGDRLGCLLIHQVDDGVDTGAVLAAQDYVIPRNCRTPAEIHGDYLNRLLPFIISFLESGLAGSKSVEASSLPAYIGSYFPRLHTPTHGWIDWTLPGPEIERFILAFDEPYPGALAFWNNELVHLKSCQLHGGEPRLADWQSGTVIRKGDGFLVVGLRDGWSLIVEHVRNKAGQDVLAKVREGDRLAGVRSDRVTIGPHGPK